MRIILATILFLLFATEIASAQSTEAAHETEQLVIDRQIANETTRLADVTSDLADYTLYLFIATIGMAAVTAGLFWIALRGHRHSAEATNAAVENTTQFREKERARLVADGVDCIVTIDRQPDDSPTLRCKISVYAGFYNYGSTPALIGKMRIGFVVDRELPARVTLKNFPGHPAYYQVPIMPEKATREQIAFHDEIVLPAELAWEVQANATATGLKVFVVGSITYKDIFGVIRTFVFASKRRKNGDVVPTKGDAYNRDYEPLYEEVDVKEAEAEA